MKYQIVADRHAAIETAYADTPEEAEAVKVQMTKVCSCGATHAVEIRQEGDFIPDDD